MRAVFSDETGTGDASADPLTVVAAVLLDMDRQWQALDKAFRFALIGIPDDERRLLLEGRMQEAKGKRLFSAMRRRPESYARTLLAAFAELPRLHDFPIFYGAVSRGGLERRREASRDQQFLDPKADIYMDAAFRECIERVDRWCNAAAPDERLIWIADHPGRHERTLLSANRLLDFVRMTNLDRAEVRGSCIVDTIFFGTSEHSHALQLVDVFCSVIREMLLGRDDARPFYDILRPMVVDDGKPISYGD